MKKLIILPLLILFTTSAFAQTNWFTGSLDEAKALAAKEGKLLLLNFTAGVT